MRPGEPRDLLTYVRVFWRWKFLFLAFVIAAPLAAYAIHESTGKTYKSTTLIQVGGASAAGVSTSPSTNVQAVAQLVTTTTIASEAAHFLHPPPTSPDSLAASVTATADPNTGFITITARAASPRRAAAIANAFASAVGSFQTTQAVGTINLQIAALSKQLRAIPLTDPASRSTVTGQVSALKSLRGATGAGAQTIEPALPNPTPIGVSKAKSISVGLLLGVLLGIASVLLADNIDRRVRTPEELETVTGLPLLAAIPTAAFASGTRFEPPGEEAFQMLRVALEYVSDDPVQSVAIISPGVGDGKTTVATGLAIATARAGRRAVLVDADLRRPEASDRLGIKPRLGLGSVLTGERELDDVLVEVELDAPEGGRLLVLPAEPHRPHPSALVGSRRMREVLDGLEQHADLVVIDTAAALAVSDSIPLVQATGASVIVARLNRRSRADVHRLQQMIAATRGTTVGVVATGADRKQSYDSSYYGEAPETRSRQGQRLRGRLRRRPAVSSNGAGSNNGTVTAPDDVANEAEQPEHPVSS